MKQIKCILVTFILLSCLSACSSESKKATIVPDFTGHDVSEVYEWCAELDERYACEVSYVDGNGVERDLVMEQSVKGGSRLNSDISFSISNGFFPEISVLHVTADTNKSDVEVWKAESGLETVNYVEENSDTVAKNHVIRIEPTSGIHKDTVVTAYISIGPKEAPAPVNTDIEVVFGDYIGLTVEEFEKAAKKLGLTPNHNTSRDKFSADIEFGKIVWHGSGTYVKDEIFNYGVCINEINISANQYYGWAEEDFKAAAKKLTLVPTHITGRDAYSTALNKGDIVTHGWGTYVKGEEFKYGLALGPAKVQSGYEGASEEVLLNYLASMGLKGKRTVQTSETIAEGRVIGYNTGKYSSGDSVTYVISAGPDLRVNVRDFSGEAEETFLTFLKSNGLKAGIRTLQTSMVPAGRIISNDSGTKKKGDSINYIVSSGPMIPTARLDSFDDIQQSFSDEDGSYSKVKERMEIYLKSKGFTNYEIKSEFTIVYRPGTVLYITVDGQTHDKAAEYPTYASVVVAISGQLMSGD